MVFVLLFLCYSAVHLGRVRVPFPRDFRPRSSRRDKGVRVKERDRSFPLYPLCWMAAQDSETDSVRSVDVFPSPYFLVTATALATRSKEEERNAEPVRNWLHENVRSLTELALKRFDTAKSRILSLIKIKALLGGRGALPAKRAFRGLHHRFPSVIALVVATSSPGSGLHHQHMHALFPQR
jgi:hypothetical protein